MADHLMTALAPHGIAPHHVEGLAQGRWVLLDYVDFVVHVFHPELREFYQLERLWGDAPVVVFSSRRRHTRFDCDWSSDVCSSDLDAVAQIDARAAGVALLL